MRLTGGLSVRFSLFAKYVPHFIVSSLVVGGIFAGSGCGSGSGNPNPKPTASATPTPVPSTSPTPSVAPVTLQTRVVWGLRSRQVGTQVNAVGGPSSALSARIVLAKATPGGGDLTLNVDRSVLGGPQDYSSAPQQAIPGIYILNATFYALNGQQGAVVGTAQASVTVLGNGTLSTTIATVGRVQKVVVNPSTTGGIQTVGVGQTVDISYSALDASGNVLALTPGSAFVSVVPNTLLDGTLDTVTRATANAESVTGVFPNRATVIVSVDGVNSARTQIVVRSTVVVVINPPGTPGGTVSVGIGQMQTFTATTANDGPAGSNGVTWQILKNGAADTANNAGTLSTFGPSTQTVLTATGVLGNQSNPSTSYILRATSVYDPDFVVDTPIQIVSQVAVSATPNPVTLSINQTQQFIASVTLLPSGADSGVVWSVQTINGGKITSDGIYTAPATPSPVNSPFIVRATSRFDKTRFVDIAVTVQDGQIRVIVN